ncbi:uncharacterized protein LOC135845281 [Planococcus citri]|uniref:uncharacterized protein LOC135845281 n=1 Tax=Planococcus citri TaxID=170843 RepID=UPI0031F9F621
MLFIKSLIFLCSLSLGFSQKKKDFTCVPMNSCQCMFQNGLGIDLNGLNVTFNAPGTLIIFHPCSNIFPSDTVFQNHTVAMNHCEGGSSLCLYEYIDSNHSKMINLGEADSLTFQTSSDGTDTDIKLLFEYESWKTTIHLQCSPQGDLGVLDLIKMENQNIELSLVSRRSCLTRDFSEVPMSGWVVAVIIIIALVVFYFFGGAALLRIVFGNENGDIVMHQTFLMKLKDRLKGIPSYFASCCQSSRGYEEI